MTDVHDGLAERIHGFSWNTSDPETAMELCRRAQDAEGMLRSEADGGFRLAARYEDVVAVSRDPGTFSSSPTVLRPVAPDVPPFPVLEYDPPRHTQWRDVFRDIVNLRTVRRLQPQVVADVNRHIDRVIESGRADLVADLAEQVPVQTICRAAGIDDPDLMVAIRESTMAALLAGGRDPSAFAARLGEFAELVVPLVEQRRGGSGDDFLTSLTVLQPDGRPLNHQEIVGTMFGMLAAGHHSTTSSMCSLFVDVLTRPQVRARLTEEPGIITTVIEESLRRDAPFYGFYRRATSPATVGAATLDADESICLAWAAANNDPREFPDPEEFRLDRKHYRHVTFGYGIHTCVGAPLARLELQVALEQVLARMPDIEMVGEVPTKYFGGGGVTYIESLPVRFTPGRRL